MNTNSTEARQLVIDAMQQAADEAFRALHDALAGWSHTEHSTFDEWRFADGPDWWAVTAMAHVDQIAINEPRSDGADGTAILRHIPAQLIAGVLVALGAPEVRS